MSDQPPRIVIRHHTGRTWTATPRGAGHGRAWGVALADLDHHATCATDGWPVTYYLDHAVLPPILRELEQLGIPVDQDAA